MATTFTVSGPYEMRVTKAKAGRKITRDNIDEFWSDHPSVGARRGCYVFGIRAGKGMTPGYVGKATKSFKQEIFEPHKLNKYHEVLVDYLKGTAVFFFIELPVKQGKPNASHIGELEKFLIQTGVAVNPDLVNVKDTKAAEWGIRGVLRSGAGKPSHPASEFKSMFKLHR